MKGCAIRMSNIDALIKEVMRKSESDIWDLAVDEWYIENVTEDRSLSGECVCGKENLRYLFTIRNSKNNNVLFPIGSSCIEKFDRDDLNDEARVNKKLFELLHAIQDGDYITLDADYFSRKLLKFLFEDEAFAPTEYNDYDGYNDYEFMLKMFNQRNQPSEKQQGKINAIIMFSIRPYLQNKLKGKIA